MGDQHSTSVDGGGEEEEGSEGTASTTKREQP